MKKASILVSAMLLFGPSVAFADTTTTGTTTTSTTATGGTSTTGTGWGSDWGHQNGSGDSSDNNDDNQGDHGDYHGDGSDHGNHYGIQNALQHVKNPHALQVLQAILNGQSPSDVVGSMDSSTLDSTDGSTTADTLITSLEQDQTDSTTSKVVSFKKLGSLLQQNGDVTNAIQALQDGAQLDPTNLDTMKQLGQLFQKRGDKDVKAFVNGKQPNFDVKPVIKDGRTLVPVRAIAESLGAKVTWNEATKTVTFTKDNNVISLTIGSKTITINGKPATIDVPATEVNGRTIVPVRFISEALKANIQWIPDGQIVTITTDPSSNPPATSGNGTTASTSSSSTDQTTTGDQTTTDGQTSATDTSSTDASVQP